MHKQLKARIGRCLRPARMGRTAILLLGVLLWGAVGAWAAVQASMDWSVISSGGGRHSGGSIVIEETVGQPAVGQAGAGNVTLEAGYWYGVQEIVISPTATRTPTRTATPTLSGTPSPTRTATCTGTPVSTTTSTATPSPTRTATRTGTPVATVTPTTTPSPTPHRVYLPLLLRAFSGSW